jgi:DNA modification methylase
MIIHGDSLEVLKTLDANSVDSVVTDPPYGWRFMGKAWDAPDIAKMAKQGKRPGETFVGYDGSTLVACERLGFKYVGVERELDYVRIAEKRVADAKR